MATMIPLHKLGGSWGMLLQEIFLIWWFVIAYEAIFEPNNFISVLPVVTAAIVNPLKAIEPSCLK